MNIQIVCPECGVFNDAHDVKCWKCKRLITEEEKQSAVEKSIKSEQEEKHARLRQEENDSLVIDKAKSTGDWSKVPEELLNKVSQKIVLTTSDTLASQEVETEVAIVTAEVAYGMNIFRDLFAGVRDIVGGRSGAVQKVFRDARNTVLSELKKEAMLLGADAVIAVDLNYQELSGGGKNGMVLLVASGTAVKVNKRY